jgi:TDG/mug DNA glycosylase family protein
VGAKGPSREELNAAAGKPVPDVIAAGLRVLFCGINPGLYSAAVGHHFARPGNRFWPAIYQAGFTPRLLAAAEDGELPRYGCGITNLVARATASAGELAPAELAAGGQALAEKVARYRPRVLAVLGVTAYRTAFARPRAALGPQAERVAGAAVWVLPNPSGLNAHWTPVALAAELARLREAAGLPDACRLPPPWPRGTMRVLTEAARRLPLTCLIHSTGCSARKSATC